ncbi:hypothetical protein V1478_012756 [Vespula squamosa]|uniref:Uncharacterized protein n=1 Tax=Vespula squamosa TaxID=30214 RepID=A0ABD2A8V2_VESSQ
MVLHRRLKRPKQNKQTKSHERARIYRSLTNDLGQGTSLRPDRTNYTAAAAKLEQQRRRKDQR